MAEDRIGKDRMLELYTRLAEGKLIYKAEEAEHYKCSLRSIQRDIEDLRTFFHNQSDASGVVQDIIYDKKLKGYKLVPPLRNVLSNKEVFAVLKILLESRAFVKDELSTLIEKLIMQIAPSDRSIAENIIRNEYFNYVPLRHGKKLLEPIWLLSQFITDHKVISFSYNRQDGKESFKTVKPVSIMFSEFYFYLIAFSIESDTDHPIIFRIDRIKNLKPTGEKFFVPYKDRFDEGEFRKRIQFMYSGDLKTVTFEYSGVLEAILDRLPTAKVLSESDGVYTIRAESYGDGIFMWLRSQNCKIL